MRATKSDSVMSAEKLEMDLVYGKNYASTKIGSVSYFGHKWKIQAVDLILQNLNVCEQNI